MERDQIQRRLLLRLFGEPITLSLGIGGTMALLSAPLFGLTAAVPAFLGVSGIAGAAGILAVRGILWKDDLTRQLIEEIEQEEATARTARLDRLHQRLEMDRDPRTEALLNDLRALVEAVREEGQWRQKVNVVAAADILRRIDQLFSGCVQSLERTLELHQTTARLSTRSAGEPLRNERERIIGEIEATVSRMGQLVTELRVLGTQSDDTAPDLARIRAELDSNLEAVRATAAETQRWVDENPG